MKFILHIFTLLLCLSARALLGYIRQNKTNATQANSFISVALSCAASCRRAPQRRILSLRLKPQCPKRLEHLSDEFFFKFFINFRPRMFVFARQFVVKFCHIAAAFAVELDHVSPYGAVF